MSSYIEGCLSSKAVFHQRYSFIKGGLQSKVFSPSKVVFHKMLSFIKGHLQLRLFFSKGCLSLKVALHQRSFSIQGWLPLKGVFQQRLSSIKGCLPWKIIFYCRFSFINLSPCATFRLLHSGNFFMRVLVVVVTGGKQSQLQNGRCIRSPLVTKLFEVIFLHGDITQRDLKNSSHWYICVV